MVHIYIYILCFYFFSRKEVAVHPLPTQHSLLAPCARFSFFFFFWSLSAAAEAAEQQSYFIIYSLKQFMTDEKQYKISSLHEKK